MARSISRSCSTSASLRTPEAGRFPALAFLPFQRYFSLVRSASSGHREAPTGFPRASPAGKGASSREITMKLTAKVVGALALPAGKTDVIHFDDELHGF